MPGKRITAGEGLQLAIDSLPRKTRIAMLAGLDANTIIVGAYTTSDGVCPMLAAHRSGGRTSTIAFAKAWDRFALGDSRRKRRQGEPRPATEQELLALRSFLETSLLIEDARPMAPNAAHREHLELIARRGRASAVGADDASADIDCSRTLGERPGWAWSSVLRDVDDSQRILRLVRAELGTVEERPVRKRVARRALASTATRAADSVVSH